MTNNNRLTRTIMTWVLASITMLFSQTEVYTTDSHSMPLYENQNQQIIQLADDISRSQFSDYISSVSDVQIVREFGVHSNVFLLENVVSSDWTYIKQLIENNTNVIRWIPAYYLNVSLSEESEFLISDRISVKFNVGTSDDEINQFASEFGLHLVNGNATTRRCVLKMNSENSMNPLVLAMLLDSDLRTIWGQIVHTTPIVRLVDEFYPDQWHLNNTSQSGGSSGYDINAEIAWNITTGLDDIIIAVIDDGVEEHEDFEDWQLLDGYSIEIDEGEEGCCGRPDSNDPNDPYHDKHGQSVAGLVSAYHNEIGVRGAGSSFKILPINMFTHAIYYDDFNILLANAIDWAWQNNADVLSNSWGYPIEGYWDADVAGAIISAMTEGRNGLGCPVVFAAGNSGFVSFPSNVDGVITVGGMGHNGNKYDNVDGGSAISPLIDIVAPTRQGNGAGGIVTMDRMGALGYSAGNYTFNFGGTSASCPQVSGVVGLILSILPELNKNEVDDILYLTARELTETDPDNSWSGNGLVNAYEAVFQSQLYYLVDEGLISIFNPTITLWQENEVRTFYCDDFPDGIYVVDSWKFEVDVPTEYMDNPASWFYDNGPDDITGYNGANPNYCADFLGEIDEGDNTHLITFYYYLISDVGGEPLYEWIPNEIPIRPLIYSHGIIGDVNIDESVDIFDIVTIVNHILGNSPFNLYNKWAADFIQDGDVNVTDIAGIVDYILGEILTISQNDLSPSGSNLVSKVLKQKGDPPYVQQVKLFNDEPLPGGQFALKVAQGFQILSIIPGEKAEGMNLECKTNIEGTIAACLVFSLEGNTISTGPGILFEIGLESQGLGRNDDDPDSGEFLDIKLVGIEGDESGYVVVNSDDFSRLAEQEPESSTLPFDYAFGNNYPNPFNPITTITYELPEESFVTISVYDLTGRKLEELVNNTFQAGRYDIKWNAQHYSSGIYFVKMVTDEYTNTQKIMLLK